LTWSLAVTVPNAEGAVSALLADRAVDHHVFRIRRSIIRRGRIADVLVPAFPRYVFIPHDKCSAVLNEVTGVTGLVRFGENFPEEVSDEVVDGLLSRCDPGDVLTIDVPDSTRFRRGDWVDVIGVGSAAGHHGLYQYALPLGRACVWFDWMGQMVPVDVDERDLCEREGVKQTNAKKKKKRKNHHRSRKLK
jgi:transcription antitermination factor NusG